MGSRTLVMPPLLTAGTGAGVWVGDRVIADVQQMMKRKYELDSMKWSDMIWSLNVLKN